MDGGYGALSSSEKAKGKEKVETMEASKTIGAVEGEDNSSAAGGLSPGDIGADASQRDEATDVWAKKMQKKIDDLFQKPHNYTASRNISAVPASTEDHGKKLYEPRAVAIGPYHRKTEDNYFSITDEHKLWCVTHVISNNYKQDLGKFLGRMKKREKEAWEFYRELYGEDYLDMDPQSFLEMLMLDSCFILSALGFHYESAGLCRMMEPLTAVLWARRDIVRASELFMTDLLLLNNQIPFFILEDVFKMQNEGKGSIIPKALCYFDTLGLGGNWGVSSQDTKTGEVPRHLLHLYHMYLRPPERPSATLLEDILEHTDPRRSLPSATELLRKSAVSFKMKKMESQSALDVTTRKSGDIEMPALCVYDHTNILLHNLIAFEQTPTFITTDVPSRTFAIFNPKSHITAYVAFMEQIVRRDEDVELLESSGVLVHRLTSSTEVVTLFSQLHNVIDPCKTPGYLAKVYKEVFSCCDSKWRRMYAGPNIWLSISFVAGMAVSVLTLIEAIYAIIGFYQC